MNNQTQIFQWATDWLVSQGYILEPPPETLLETPWSLVVRFSTSKGNIYLKQTPEAISEEPKIIQFLAEHCDASVPVVLATNDEHHCFLMKDAGKNLRQYLKADFQPDLLSKAVKQYTTLQRAAEPHIESFFALGVPDWRLEKLPLHYDQMLKQEAPLIDDGLTKSELQRLRDLSPKFSEQCQLLSQYPIRDTIGISDINTNNVLIETETKRLTCIDWGESVITHPFFALHNYLIQATMHHPVKMLDETYRQVQEACLENWLDVASKEQLIAAFELSKKLALIYQVLSAYRLIDVIGLKAFQSYYAKRPHRLANFLREYMKLCNSI